VKIIYQARKDTALERDANLLGNIYKFVLDCHAKKETATSRVSCPEKGVRNTGEVSHVDQRPG